MVTPHWRDLPADIRGHSPYTSGPYVYLVYAPEVDRVKIGWSVRNPRHRVAALEVGSPCLLQLAAVFAHAARQDEATMQADYYGHHFRGEWFDRGADIIQSATGYPPPHAGAITIVDGARTYTVPSDNYLRSENNT